MTLPPSYETLDVLSCPLEEMSPYSHFTDLISSVPLMRGKGEGALQVGEFKVWDQRELLILYKRYDITYGNRKMRVRKVTMS